MRVFRLALWRLAASLPTLLLILAGMFLLLQFAPGDTVDALMAQMGGGDAALAAARAALGPQAIIGASCYDELDLARRAVAAGASYVAFGAFFPTRSKVTTRRATPTLLGEAAALGVPRVAIGGITPDNAPQAVAAGADLLAVIGGVFDAPDPVDAARRIASAFDPLPPESP